MRKSLLFIALCALTFSCTEDFPENQSAQDSTTPSLKIMSLTENDAKQKFAEILSKAIYENIDLRSFIKDKAIQQFDNDFDVFYPILKNEEVGNSETVETQFYASDGALYDQYRFRWYWGDSYNRNLVLDYGTNGISFMDDVRVYGDRLSGIFYLSDNAPGFNFELRME